MWQLKEKRRRTPKSSERVVVPFAYVLRNKLKQAGYTICDMCGVKQTKKIINHAEKITYKKSNWTLGGGTSTRAPASS
jgi:hypothetical protein